MGHEFRALARFPHRPVLGWGVVACGCLVLLAALAPPLSGVLPPEVQLFDAESCAGSPMPRECVQELPADPGQLPEPEEIEALCFHEIADGVLNAGKYTGSECREDRLQDRPETTAGEELRSFVDQLPRRMAHPLPLTDTARWRVSEEAERIARLYQERREQMLGHEVRVDEGLMAHFARVEEQRAVERAAWEKEWARWVQERTKRAWLAGCTALCAAALLAARRITRPVPVVVSVGRVQLGSRVVSIEDVAAWEFGEGTAVLLLKDETLLSPGLGRRLGPADRAAMNKAMRVAQERVVTAEPLDRQALAAVRKLAE